LRERCGHDACQSGVAGEAVPCARSCRPFSTRRSSSSSGTATSPSASPWPDARTTAWCRECIDLDGGWILQPEVLGPDGIPIITDVAIAESAPELAVLSAMAHGHAEHGAEIALAAIRSARAARRAGRAVRVSALAADDRRRARAPFRPQAEHESGMAGEATAMAAPPGMFG
jgi:hypothetical protein